MYKFIMSQNDTQAITPIIDNIILDDSVAHNVDDIENSSIVLSITGIIASS